MEQLEDHDDVQNIASNFQIIYLNCFYLVIMLPSLGLDKEIVRRTNKTNPSDDIPT